MIGASRYNPWETETFMITAVSADGMTLTLNESLKYDHLGMYRFLIIFRTQIDSNFTAFW